MSFYKTITEGIRREIDSEKIIGPVVGIVKNNKDPDGQARIKVAFPWLSDSEESQWARMATFMAGAKMGAFFLPDVGDEVLVVFEHGDINRPYILGALWNGVDKPPASNDNGKNNMRLILSRSGHMIRLDDTDGGEKIEIIDKSGKNFIEWDTASNRITISADQDVEIKAEQGKISINAAEVEIKSSGNTTIEASGNMTVKGAVVNIN